MFIQGNNVYPWSSGRYVPVLNSFLHCALYSTSSYADIPFDMQQDFIHSLLRTCTSKGRARVNLASGILCCRLVWRYLWGGVKEGGVVHLISTHTCTTWTQRFFLFFYCYYYHFLLDMATAKSASYDYLIKLLLIGDSGNKQGHLVMTVMLTQRL